MRSKADETLVIVEALKEYGGGCIIPRRDSHLLQLYAFLQNLF